MNNPPEEVFTIPGVGALIEGEWHGMPALLLQERCKADAPGETGFLEIPAGKLRAFENIFDGLRREIREETGMELDFIQGEAEAITVEDPQAGYRVVQFVPFSCSQNCAGTYPILVQVFLARARGTAWAQSDESRNIRWMPLEDVARQLRQSPERFYPMHRATLETFLRLRGI